MVKNDKSNWRLEFLLFIVVVIIAVVLFYDTASYTHFICSRGPSQGQRMVFDWELLIILSVIAVIISMLLKLNDRKLFSVLSILLLVWLIMIYPTILNPPCPPQCAFPAGLACVNVEIYQNGELDLTLGQGTGHTINITGVACSDNMTSGYRPANVIYASGGSVLMTSGTQAIVAQPGGNLTVECTSGGSAITNATLGSSYIGNLYINYTELDARSVQRITIGSLRTEVYPPPYYWADPFYYIVGTTDTLLLPLVLVWFVLGGYLFLKPKQA